MKPKIIGTGSVVPETVMTNEDMCHLIGFDTIQPDWIKERTMIQERRLADFDVRTGKRKAGAVLDTDLAEQAARKAIDDANIQADNIDALIAVTCTPDEPLFSYPATELHRRLELSPHTSALHINSGCAGLALATEEADAHIRSGKRQTILITASNLPSAHIDRARYLQVEYEWFPVTVFGDGAGAMVVQARIMTQAEYWPCIVAQMAPIN